MPIPRIALALLAAGLVGGIVVGYFVAFTQFTPLLSQSESRLAEALQRVQAADSSLQAANQQLSELAVKLAKAEVDLKEAATKAETLLSQLDLKDRDLDEAS